MPEEQKKEIKEIKMMNTAIPAARDGRINCLIGSTGV